LIYLAKWQDGDQRCLRRDVWRRFWYPEDPAWAPSPSSYNQRRRIPTSGCYFVTVTTLRWNTHTRDAISTFKLAFFGPAPFPVFPVTDSFVLSLWFGRERPKWLIFRTLLGLVAVVLCCFFGNVRPYIMVRVTSEVVGPSQAWHVLLEHRLWFFHVSMRGRMRQGKRVILIWLLCFLISIQIFLSFSCFFHSSPPATSSHLTVTFHVINDVIYPT